MSIKSDACSSFLDDFMLLLCASLQRQVFDDENKAAVRIMAGDNVEICRDLDAASFSVHNPVPDFIHSRCGDFTLNVTDMYTAAGNGSNLIPIRDVLIKNMAIQSHALYFAS